MNDTYTSTQDDPAAIEQDIRRTQDEMSRTVDRIGDQLTPKKIVNALLDKADESGVDTQYLIDGARRNPMALGLIAAGAIWLVSDKDSKFPSMPSRGKKREAATKDDYDLYGDSDVHHRDYVSHMSAFEMREGEDQDSYLRRRDLHRANFLMCEREPNEDDHSFRARLNQMTDKFREKRSAWSDSASQTGSAARQRSQQLASSARDGARQASYRAQDMYSSNPLVGGILAAAVGAALGTTIPVTRKEQETLGGLGEKARDLASQQKEQLTSAAMEKKDQLLEKADQKLEQSQQGQSGQGGSQDQFQREPAFQSAGDAGSGTTQFGSSGTSSSSDGPFIASDRTS
jgi:hypothetical protein